MEVAKISEKGQITIPIAIRRKLNLRSGDKVVFQEENGRFYVENEAAVAFFRAQERFAGVAKEAGVDSFADMQAYISEIHKELRDK